MSKPRVSAEDLQAIIETEEEYHSNYDRWQVALDLRDSHAAVAELVEVAEWYVEDAKTGNTWHGKATLEHVESLIAKHKEEPT